MKKMERDFYGASQRDREPADSARLPGYPGNRGGTRLLPAEFHVGLDPGVKRVYTTSPGLPVPAG